MHILETYIICTLLVIMIVINLPIFLITNYISIFPLFDLVFWVYKKGSNLTVLMLIREEAVQQVQIYTAFCTLESWQYEGETCLSSCNWQSGWFIEEIPGLLDLTGCPGSVITVLMLSPSKVQYCDNWRMAANLTRAPGGGDQTTAVSMKAKCLSLMCLDNKRLMWKVHESLFSKVLKKYNYIL